MKQEVAISCSGEKGVVIGRAEFSYAQPIYLIRYADASGPAVEKYWDGAALRKVAPSIKRVAKKPASKSK